MNKKNDILIQKLINALPQLQCQKCKYDDCASYAQAIVLNQENTSKCEPGSTNTEKQLKNILLNNTENKNQKIENYKIAYIDTSNCIGCKICLKICPVDAIIGAKHQMHYIIDDLCNGCELCISECPVDCMKMIENKNNKSWIWPSIKSEKSKQYYYQKLKRINSKKIRVNTSLNDRHQENQIKEYLQNAIKKESARKRNLKQYE
tara:strand:+ start:4259 stop:4873 length:615 start_codon:yes stop_codon:yes gene_type:complete